MILCIRYLRKDEITGIKNRLMFDLGLKWEKGINCKETQGNISGPMGYIIYIYFHLSYILLYTWILTTQYTDIFLLLNS